MSRLRIIYMDDTINEVIEKEKNNSTSSSSRKEKVALKFKTDKNNKTTLTIKKENEVFTTEVFTLEEKVLRLLKRLEKRVEFS